MILNEKDYIGGLKQWAGNQIATAADAVKAGLGSNTAVGKLNIRAVTQALLTDWKKFCGERKMANQEGYDPYDPTMSEIEEFLKKRYNIDFDLTSEPQIADAAEAAGVQDDDAGEEAHPTDGMKATSKNEYENLKKMAVRAGSQPGPAKRKPHPVKDKLHQEMNDDIAKDKAEGLPTKESVELTEAGRGDALRRLFGMIALHLWDQGLAKVKRGEGPGGREGTIHSSGGTASASASADDEDSPTADIETAVDNNGTYLDAEALREQLMKNNIGGEMIARLKDVVKQGSLVVAFDNADAEAKRQMVAIAAATTHSMRKAKASMRAGDNMTPDGNTLNFKMFKQTLTKNGVKGTEIAMAKKALEAALKDDGKIDEDEAQRLMSSNDEVGKAILGITAATIMAIQKVGRQQQQDDKPQQDEKPEAPEKDSE